MCAFKAHARASGEEKPGELSTDRRGVGIVGVDGRTDSDAVDERDDQTRHRLGDDPRRQK